MEYINFGKVENVRTSVPVAVNDTVYHIIIDFVPNRPEIFDSFPIDMGKILECPDDYVLCNVSDIVKAQDELLKLKDRVKELEDQLKDAKKESDKRLCEVYMETNATLYSGAYSLIAIGKELEDLKKQAEQMEELEKENQALKDRNGELANRLSFMGDSYSKLEKDLKDLKKENQALKDQNGELEKDRDYWKTRFCSVVADFSDIPELKSAKKKIAELEKELKDLKSKTVAEIRYEWHSDCFSVIYTKCDGTKEVVGMDLAGDIDATSISCRMIPKCSSCVHHMHNPSRFTHDWCYILKGGSGYIRKLSKEESEGPACSDFKARKE